MLVGSASPRVRCAPSSELPTEGADAAWLASRYGLTPDDWQTNVLCDWMRVRDQRWAAARAGLSVARQNGKNGVLEVRELYGMVELGERFLHTAHEVKTARKAFRRLLEFFDSPAFPELRALVVEIRRANGQEAIFLANGGSIEFVARSSGSGRGFSVDVLVCDEAQALTEDELEALRPTISASANPQLIFTGTPPKPGREKGAIFRRMRETGVLGTDERLAWSEWSCPDDLSTVDLDSPAMWVEQNPGCPARLRESTIADERKDFSDESFARERLGWWEPLASALADDFKDAWHGLADAAAEQGRHPVFGVDVDEDRAACIAVAWRRPDGKVQVGMIAAGLATPDALARLRELHGRWFGRIILGGPAAAFAADLEGSGIPLHSLSGTEFAQACGGVADAVAAGALCHDNDPRLNASVAGFRWRSVGTAGERAWVLKDAAGIGPLAAATRALWGLWNAPAYDPLDSVR